MQGTIIYQIIRRFIKGTSFPAVITPYAAVARRCEAHALNPSGVGETMSMYKYIKDLWKKPRENMGDDYRAKVSAWQKENTTVRLVRPTRIDRARTLGYKAKQGIFVVRQRVGKSHRMRPQVAGGRRSKAQRRKKVVAKNYQRIAEERAQRSFTNCEVLNSYWVGENGKFKWYEVIFVDTNHPRIKSDPKYNNLGNSRGRVFRGLTRAGRRSRGLLNRGKGTEKVRPSVNAGKGRAH